MNKKTTLFIIIFFLVAITIGVGIFIITKNQQASNLTSNLPSEKLNSLNDAQNKITYKLKIPSIKLKNESLDNIELGLKNNIVDDSNTIRLTYIDSGRALYKISESTQVRTKPIGDTIYFKDIKGTYYLISTEGVYNDSAINIGNALVPRSYISWSEGNVNYEISEFGKLGKDDLIAIAKSMI